MPAHPSPTLKAPPFSEDVLSRSELIKDLTDTLAPIPGPLTICINGAWGTGKTTFLQMWEQHLDDSGHQYLHFNAWAHDYLEDPIIPFIAELRAKFGRKPFTKVKGEAARFLTSAGPTLLKAFASLSAQGFLTDQGGVAIEKYAQAAIKSQIDESEKQHTMLANLRSELTAAIGKVVEHRDQTSLVIFIDELDRCKPTFALALLERLKHVFNVPGLLFILAIDKEQLENCVKQRYGLDCETDGYLRRFLDFTINLPRDHGTYTEHLFYRVDLHQRLIFLGRGTRDILDLAASFADHFSLSLRDQEQCICQLDYKLSYLGNLDVHLIRLLLFVIYLKAGAPRLYAKLRFQQIDQEDALRELLLMNTKSKLAREAYQFLRAWSTILTAPYRSLNDSIEEDLNSGNSDKKRIAKLIQETYQSLGFVPHSPRDIFDRIDRF